MRILVGWAINALCLLALPYLMSAVHVKSFGTALLVALVLGLLNTLVRPILFVLTLPITLVTLGLFLFVINGLMFWLADRLLDGFDIDGFGWAILAAAVYSLFSWAVSTLVLGERR